MARIRTIKPEFPHSESMGRVSRDARLLFIEMWTIADDSGRLRGNSRMLASLLFPYDDDAPGLISSWLDELERENCIVRYQDESKSNYIQVCQWKTHQKIDKPSESKLPGPDSCMPREDSRIVVEDSRKIVQDQGPRTKERKGEERRGEDANRTAPKVPNELSEAWAKWVAYILESQGKSIGAIEAEATLKSLLDRGADKAIRDIEFSIVKRCKTIRDSNNDYDKPKGSGSSSRHQVDLPKESMFAQ